LLIRAIQRGPSPVTESARFWSSAKMSSRVRRKPKPDRPMKPSIALATHLAAIRRIVEAHRARNARVFGSVLHGTDRDGSDLDVLVDPTPNTTLMDIGAIRHELLQLLGVPVDVVTPNALPARIRDQVMAEAVPT
jgi:predicted nucleotidyltransferase